MITIMITCSNEMFLKQILLSKLESENENELLHLININSLLINHLSVVTTYIQLILNKSCVLNNMSPAACEIMNSLQNIP